MPCCRYKIIKMYKFKSLLHPAPPLLRQRCRVDVPRDHRDPKRQSWLRGGTSDQYREAWPCSAVSSGERVKLVKATIKAFWADYVGVWIAAYSKHLITQHPSSSGNYERTSIQQMSYETKTCRQFRDHACMLKAISTDFFFTPGQ